MGDWLPDGCARYMADSTDGGERSIGHRDWFSTWKKRRAWVQRGLGTSTTLHARHLNGPRGIFEPVRASSRSRRSGHLLLHAGLGPDARLGPLLRLLHAGLQRALVERLPAPEPEGVPIHRARFREVDQVEQALGVLIRASVIGAGEREAPAANLVGILAGDMGHGVEQVTVTHGLDLLGKVGNGKLGNTQGHRPPTQRAGRRKTRPAARGADGETEKAVSRFADQPPAADRLGSATFTAIGATADGRTCRALESSLFGQSR